MISARASRLPRPSDVADLLAADGVFLRRTTTPRVQHGVESFAALTWPVTRARIEAALRALEPAAACRTSHIRALGQMARRISILKIGGSSSRTAGVPPRRCVHRRSALRARRRLVVVVSARNGATDAALDRTGDRSAGSATVDLLWYQRGPIGRAARALPAGARRPRDGGNISNGAARA
jgi:hypothetical protein